MKQVRIPGPKINSFMEGFQESLSYVELLETAVEIFFGHRVSLYFQGEFTAKNRIKMTSMAQILAEGIWTLNGSVTDLKNVVFIMHNNQVKMQCNFNQRLPDTSFLKLKEFKEKNPLIIYKVTKWNRSIELFFKDVYINKESVYEC